MGQLEVLYILSNNNQLSTTELTMITRLCRSSVQTAIRKLRKRGLVRMKKGLGPFNNMISYQITEKGREWVKPPSQEASISTQ